MQELISATGSAVLEITKKILTFVDKIGPDVLFFVSIIIIGLVYAIGLVKMLCGVMFKFGHKLNKCNKGLEAISVVDKTNKRHFYGIINSAPKSVKKCWQDYEYFRKGRIVDYFNKDELLENVKRHSCTRSLLILFSVVFPMLMSLLFFIVSPLIGFSVLFIYVLLIGLLQTASIIVVKVIKSNAYKQLEYFLEQLTAKANWFAEIERPRTVSVLEDYVESENPTIENDIKVGEANDILNDDLISKAMSNKGLKKSEKEKIANSILHQAEENQILADEMNKKKEKKKAKPESVWKEDVSNETVVQKTESPQATGFKYASVPTPKYNQVDYTTTTQLIENELNGKSADEVKTMDFDGIVSQIREVKAAGVDKTAIQSILLSLQHGRNKQIFTPGQIKALNSEINEMLKVVKNKTKG